MADQACHVRRRVGFPALQHRRVDIASGELNGARSDRLRRQSLPRALPSELREPGFLPSATVHCVLD